MKITPSYKEFLDLSKKGNTIPFSLEFPADLETPVSVFLKAAAKKKNAFLLESVELGERLGRFSFIGMDPDAILDCKDGHCYLTKNGKRTVLENQKDPLHIIERVMECYRYVPDSRLPKFTGGFVGYIGYELVSQFEDIRLHEKHGLKFPDAVLFFARNVIAFDHIKHHLKIIHLAHVDRAPEKVYQRAIKQIQAIEAQLKRPLAIKSNILNTEKSGPQGTTFRSNVSRNQFEKMVRKAKEYIRSGDIIQVVLSQRFDLGLIHDEFGVYRTLRSLNPSPYMFYFKYGKQSLIGSSPEVLTRKTGTTAEVKPIAGTRPRGQSEKDDLAYESALRASRKEMAEHLMLVDLGRNDLGRVSERGSVHVKEFARVERYSHVMHLVSDVTSRLKPNKTAYDLLRATFPAGTVSGAPKIRAMQIIDELEPEKRGPYAGSLGYFSLNGDMDMCITIRTILIDHQRAYVQAGAGIVYDSKPRNEYKETINKAKALFQAVERSRG